MFLWRMSSKVPCYAQDFLALLYLLSHQPQKSIWMECIQHLAAPTATWKSCLNFFLIKGRVISHSFQISVWTLNCQHRYAQYNLTSSTAENHFMELRDLGLQSKNLSLVLTSERWIFPGTLRCFLHIILISCPGLCKVFWTLDISSLLNAMHFTFLFSEQAVL